LPWLNLLVKYIGKIGVISSFIFHGSNLDAQFNDSVKTNYWPSHYSGDTQYFQRANGQITSNYSSIEKKEFQFNIKLDHALPKFLVRLDLELKINTSSTNTISFGFKDSSGNSQSVKIGNTFDRWEGQFNKQNIPGWIGLNNEFASTNFKGTIQLLIDQDSITITTLHTDSKQLTEWKVQTLLTYNEFFYIAIQQSGKTAFQGHRFSNILIDSLPNIQFTDHQIHQFSNKIITFKNSIFIKSKNGKININGQKRDFQLKSDLTSVDIPVLQFDSNNIRLELDSFYSIWHEPIDKITLIVKLISISPVQRGDIILSEIMPKPEPALNRFPATEYIELCNTSAHYKCANEINLSYNGKKIELPDSLFPPNQPILLVENSELDIWKNWLLNSDIKSGKIWGISNFPILLNSEGTLILQHSVNGQLLDSLHYEINILEPYAVGGGFSYECNNFNVHSNHLKWKTTSSIGGSPLTIFPVDNHNYPVEIIETYLDESLTNQIKINTHWNLFDIIYHHEDSLILKNLFNGKEICLLNSFVNIDKTGPLYLNEIYSRSTAGTDFVEIYNPNTKAILLENYDLLIYDEKHQIKYIISLKNDQRTVIMPNEFMVFCANKHPLKRQFNLALFNSIVELESFPNLSINGGYLSLVNHVKGISDECSFELTEPINRIIDNNTSLEKIHPLLLSKNQVNWLDCILELKASPTQSNSNTLIEPLNPKSTKNWVRPTSSRIYKNHLGYYTIPLELKIPYLGCLLKIDLYNIWGDKILNMCNLQPVISTGFIQWPLINNQFQLNPGNYIITFEIANQTTGIKIEYYRISLL